MSNLTGYNTINNITLTGLSDLSVDTLNVSTDVIIPRVDTALIPTLGDTISLATLCQNLYYDNVNRRFQIYSDNGTTMLFQVDTLLNTILAKPTKFTLLGTVLSLDTGSTMLVAGISISPTELSYLKNATSNIQAQLNAITASLSGYVTLTTTQTITGTKTMNDLLPIFATNTTSYKMGTNAMQYQQATSANNIAWGTNALRGKSTLPANNVSKRNICIGDNAGQNMQDSPCDDNVIIGYNAGRTMFYQSQQSVIIGSNAYGLNAWSLRNVVIGYNAVGTGTTQNTDCVLIGANCGVTFSGKSNAVVIGAGNGYISSSFSVVGSFNLTSATQGNRITILGSQNLINVAFDAFNCAIGNENGASQTSGFYNIYIGQFCNVASSGILNSAVIGVSAIIPRSHCLYLGASTADLITYQNVCIAFKNTLRCVKTITGVSYAVLFEDNEYLYLTDDVTTSLQLPTPATGSGTVKNVGASWTITRAQATASTITINAPSGQTIRLPSGVTAASYTFKPTEWYVTITCVATSGTSYQVVSSQSTSINNIIRCSENTTNGTVTYGNSGTANIGLYNTLIGNNAGLNMSAAGAQLNTAVGYNTLASVTTTGQLNTALGAGAGQHNTLSRNTFIGTNTGPIGPNSIATKSTYLGGNAGATTTTGQIDECTLLGHSTDFAVATGSYRNSTAVGSHSIIASNNEIVLGGLNQTDGVSYPQVVMPAKLRLQSAQLYNTGTVYSVAFGRGQAETVVLQTGAITSINLPIITPTNVGFTCTITRAYIPVIADTISIFAAGTENIQSADTAPSSSFTMDWSITSLRLTLVDTAGTINWIASYSRQFRAQVDNNNTAYPVAFAPLTTGVINAVFTDTLLTFNPSTNTLTSSVMNATTMSATTVNALDVNATGTVTGNAFKTTTPICVVQSPTVTVSQNTPISVTMFAANFNTYKFSNLGTASVTYNLPVITATTIGWAFTIKRMFGTNSNTCAIVPPTSPIQPVIKVSPITNSFNMLTTESTYQFESIVTQQAGVNGTFSNAAGSTTITINTLAAGTGQLMIGGVIFLGGNVNANRTISAYIFGGGTGGVGTYTLSTAITLANVTQTYTGVESYGYIVTHFF